MSDLEKSVLDYKKAIRKNHNDGLAYYNLGSAYSNLSLYKEAIEACKQAIPLGSDCPDAHFELGFNCLQIGDKSSALNEYKILKELDIDKANKLFDLINK